MCTTDCSSTSETWYSVLSVCLPRVFWCTLMENTFPSETMRSPSAFSHPGLCFSFLAAVVRDLDPIEAPPDRARLPCINQSWGSAEWWVNQLDPGEEAKSSCGLAWSIQLQERQEEWVKGEGGGKEPDSKLVRIKVKEEDREQDEDQTANEGQTVMQWVVYWNRKRKWILKK